MRAINFRLMPHEYDALETIKRSSGRSIAQLCRTAVIRFVRSYQSGSAADRASVCMADQETTFDKAQADALLEASLAGIDITHVLREAVRARLSDIST